MHSSIMRNVKNHPVMAGLLAICTIYLAITLALIWGNLLIFAIDGPPVEWLYEESLPDYPLCPGEVIPITLGIRVNAAGGLEIYSPIRRASDNTTVLSLRDSALGKSIQGAGGNWVGDTVLSAASTYRTAYDEDEVPAVFIDPDVVFVVPDLPPGKYERLTVVKLEGRDAMQSIRREPFEIGADCD